MTANELQDLIQSANAIVLDIRLGRAFMDAHIPGAISAPYSQRGWSTSVANWMRQMGADQPIVLFGDNKVIAESAEKALTAENLAVKASWDGGMAPWKAAGLPVVSVANITVDDLHQDLAQWQVIDVREPYELRSGIIPGALPIPMGELPQRVNELARDKSYALVCASGSRSQSAAAWMAEQGYQVANVVGGMSLWLGSGRPTERP